jgi:hypothetical protein
MAIALWGLIVGNVTYVIEMGKGSLLTRKTDGKTSSENPVIFKVKFREYKGYTEFCTERLLESLTQILLAFRPNSHILLESDLFTHIRTSGVVDVPIAYMH